MCRLITYHHHRVATIKARSGEVVVEVVRFKSWKAIELVFRPLPHIAVDVMKSKCIGWKHVDTLYRDNQNNTTNLNATHHSHSMYVHMHICMTHTRTHIYIRQWPHDGGNVGDSDDTVILVSHYMLHNVNVSSPL